MPYIDNDPTAPNRNDSPALGIAIGGLVVILIGLVGLVFLGGDGTDGTATTPDIMTPATTVAPTVTVSGTPVITQPSVTYEQCEEPEILAPLMYGNPTHYVCVNLDDFADPASIDRLDTILNERRANG